MKRILLLTFFFALTLFALQQTRPSLAQTHNEPGDLGDAPDSSNHTAGGIMSAYGSLAVPARYPTVFDPATGAPSGPIHFFPHQEAWLGMNVTGEQDADLLPDMDGVTNIEPPTDLNNRDKGDDGVQLNQIALPICNQTKFDYMVSSAPTGTLKEWYVNVWFDFNRDGDWEDSFQCSSATGAGYLVTEWAVQDQLITILPGVAGQIFSTPLFPAMQAASMAGPQWMRITLSETPAEQPADGRGPDQGFRFGETEDHVIIPSDIPPTKTPLPTATTVVQPTATKTPLPTATTVVQPTATKTPLPTATTVVQPTATKTPHPTATMITEPTKTPEATATQHADSWFDLGDAPDSTNHAGALMSAYGVFAVPARYPTVFDALTGLPSGPLHQQPLAEAWLGRRVTWEKDADLLPDMDGLTNIGPTTDQNNRDEADDGVNLMQINLPACGKTQFPYTVSSAPTGTLTKWYVNVWFDFNQDGDWEDTFQCASADGTGYLVTEWAVQDQLITILPAVANQPFNTPLFPASQQFATTVFPQTWMRITLSESPATLPADGRGPATAFRFGETEDYLWRKQIDPQPCDLSLRKWHAPAQFVYGGIGSYTLAVTNHSSQDCFGPIVITDVLPQGMTFIPGSVSGAGWSCSADTNNPQTVTCTHSGPIPAMTSLVPVTFDVNVPPVSGAGGAGWQGDMARNCATITNPTTPNTNKTACDEVIVTNNQPTGGTLQGLKWKDLNGNGLQDAGEPTLANWVIVLRDSAGNVIATTITDAFGNYQFTGLAAGNYRLYEQQQTGWVQTFPNTVFHPVTLAANQTINHLNFGNKVKCDQTIDKRCVAGRRDNFNTTDGPEPSNPGADLLPLLALCSSGPLTEFDILPTNRCFGHTFMASVDDCLAGDDCIVGATMTITVKGGTSWLTNNDTLSIVENGIGIWGVAFNTLVPTWSSGSLATFVFDLANMPNGGANLLATLGDGDLDIFIQDDTGVDFIELAVKHCCEKEVVTYTAGLVDQFVPPTEPASPSIALDDYITYNPLANFDETQVNKFFAHTFGLPQTEIRPICAATLEIRLKPLGSSLNSNDTIGLGFIGYPAGGGAAGPLVPGWGRYLGAGQPATGLLPNQWTTANYGGGHTFTFNLGALPLASGGTASLLHHLQTLRFLDVMVQDDTAVDYVKLTVEYCCEKEKHDGGDIHGHKWNDLNGNGVRDLGEPGIGGWVILLQHPDGSVSQTVTKPDGSYSFTDLPDGQYQVKEQHRMGWIQTAPASLSYNLTIAAGGPVNNTYQNSHYDINFGNHQKREEWCHVGWNVHVNKEWDYVLIHLLINNNAGTPQTYDVAVNALPGLSSVTSFTLNPASPITVNGSQMVGVKISPIPSMLTSGAYQVVVKNTQTGDFFGCDGQLWVASNNYWLDGPQGGVQQGLPFNNVQTIVFPFHNTGNAPITIDYAFEAMVEPRDALPVRSVMSGLVSLDGLPAGTNSTGSTTVAAGETVNLSVDVELLQDMSIIGDVILYVDSNEDGFWDAASSAMVTEEMGVPTAVTLQEVRPISTTYWPFLLLVTSVLFTFSFLFYRKKR